MICSYNCEYSYEEVQKCNFCKEYIEGKFCKVIYNSIKLFYHPKCFRLLNRYNISDKAYNNKNNKYMKRINNNNI